MPSLPRQKPLIPPRTTPNRSQASSQAPRLHHRSGLIQTNGKHRCDGLMISSSGIFVLRNRHLGRHQNEALSTRTTGETGLSSASSLLSWLAMTSRPAREFADVERNGRFSGMIPLASYHRDASGLPMISLILSSSGSGSIGPKKWSDPFEAHGASPHSDGSPAASWASAREEQGLMRPLPLGTVYRAPDLPGQPSRRDPASGSRRREFPRHAASSPS